MNVREKIITDNLEFLMKHWHMLTAWEKNFVGNVQNVPPENFSQPRFNSLQDARQRVAKALLV